MDYWQKRKLRNAVIIVALIIAAVFGIRELLRPDAQLVTVKYVEDLETFRSASVVGGYNRAVSTRDEELIEEWIDLLLAVEKQGDKMESGGVDQPFPCYIVEYRLGTTIWVAMMQITENRVGRAYQLLGDDVFDFGSDNSIYIQAGKLMDKMESAAN